MKPLIEVRSIAWHGPGGEHARRIRHDVFIVEQQVPPEEEYDLADETAFHVAAYREDGTPVGTGRLLVVDTDPPGTARIGRMAVLKNARGLGAGDALMRALIAEAGNRAREHLIINSQTHAIPFYQRHGFRATGQEFIEAGIPHKRMERSIRRTEDPAT